nr:hypothetical protein GBDKHNIE_00003 [uncultured bacterium]
MNIAMITELNTVFTDDSMESILNDAILSKGSLLLVDPTHPLEQWPSGVPADGISLPNIADAFAQKLIPTGGVLPSLNRPGVMAGASFIERTQKRGLRAGVSSGQTGLSGINMPIPDAILQYMLNNQSHEYYLSMWSYVTREAEATSTNEPHMHIYRTLQCGYPLGGIASFSAQANWERPTGANKTGGYAVNTNAIGVQFRNIAGKISGQHDASGALLSLADFPQPTQKTLVSMGPANVESLYTAVNSVSSGVGRRLQSWNFYRIYIEELTVSGRSYDDVTEIDKGLYTKEMTLAGGRYFGDSWTANP